MQHSQEQVVFENEQQLSDAISQEADEVSDGIVRRNSLRLPGLGLRLPVPGDALAFYTGLGAIAALGVVEWPLALVVGAGHAVRSYSHSQALQDAVDELESEMVERLLPNGKPKGTQTMDSR